MVFLVRSVVTGSGLLFFRALFLTVIDYRQGQRAATAFDYRQGQRAATALDYRQGQRTSTVIDSDRRVAVSKLRRALVAVTAR